MFIKRVRVGTRGVGVSQPVYEDRIDWGAVGGTMFVALIVLGLIGHFTG